MKPSKNVLCLLWIAGMIAGMGVLSSQTVNKIPRPVTWLIFIDDLHIEFRQTGHLRRLLTAIAEDLIRDGDAYSVRCSGPAAISLPLRTDRAGLAQAIRNTQGNGLKPTDLVRASERPEMNDELRLRASTAAKAAGELLKAASPLRHERMALLYVSSGYPVDPVDQPLAELSGLIQRAGVIAFALNTRGLPQETPFPSHPSSDHYEAAMLNSLRRISDPTGGFAVLEPADFADALHRIDDVVR